MNQDMSEQEMVELISRHEVFSGFGQTELEQLRSVVSFREAKAKEVVFEIDDPPNNVFYLIDGALCLNFPDNSRMEVEPNDLIGEIGVLNGDFRLGRLIAEQDSQLIAIRTDRLFDTCLLYTSDAADE